MTDRTDTPIYSIGTAARRSGLTVTTIRTWEQRYRVVVPARTDTGHRVYTDNDIELFTYLRLKVESGLSAAEAHRLLEAEMASP